MEIGGENGTQVQKINTIIKGRSKTQAQTQETAVLKIIQEINPSKLRDKYNVAAWVGLRDSGDWGDFLLDFNSFYCIKFTGKSKWTQLYMRMKDLERSRL